jgi:hypothetical protein
MGVWNPPRFSTFEMQTAVHSWGICNSEASPYAALRSLGKRIFIEAEHLRKANLQAVAASNHLHAGLT